MSHQLCPRATHASNKSLSNEWEAYEDLVEKVLNELLFERSRREETMQIGSQKLRHKVSTSEVSEGSVIKTLHNAYKSSKGEMKMSLRLITCPV